MRYDWNIANTCRNINKTMDIINQLQSLKTELSNMNEGGEDELIIAIDELVAKITRYNNGEVEPVAFKDIDIQTGEIKHYDRETGAELKHCRECGR